jgi:5-aminopentanamidase
VTLVAAYQAPLLPIGSMHAVCHIQKRVRLCESMGVSILCCPEAVLGGLADYSDDPRRFAIGTQNGRLEEVLQPLASNTVTTIVGFSELADGDRLYNAGAIFERGSITGLYRKVHPAITRFVYEAGSATPVFQIGGLTFGILICNDSNFPDLHGHMASRGATALFIPTNNGLPRSRSSAALMTEGRASDVARAVENNTWIIRADVAGKTDALLSYGSSAIVDPRGTIVKAARELSEDFLIAEI